MHDIPPVLNRHSVVACVIGNGGLGDTITYVGMVNYLATQYKTIIVACMKVYYEQIKYFFTNDRIKIYPINLHDNITMASYDILMRTNPIYDVYAFGHYGTNYIDYDRYIKLRNNKTINILYDYPISYYEDVNIPINVMRDYFTVKYPDDIENIYEELLKTHPIYTLIHQIGSTQTFDIVKHNGININEQLVIDINKNLYPENHAYYEIANKFLNFRSVIFYAKLVQNASELYLIDSCIHALALVVDIKATVKICYQRECRVKYGFGKFDYYLLADGMPVKVRLPILP